MIPGSVRKRRGLYHAYDIFASPIFESRARKGVPRARAVDVERKNGMLKWMNRFDVTKSGKKNTHKVLVSCSVCWIYRQWWSGRKCAVLCCMG